MLFGSYMQVTTEGGVWRTNGVFRRYVHVVLYGQVLTDLFNIYMI